MADFVDQEEADIEDLLVSNLFVEIVNSTYELSTKHELDVAKLANADQSTERQVKNTEAYFRVLPEEIPMFDHFRPASWLISNCHVLEVEFNAALNSLDAAKNAFNAINSLIAVS